ncbi:hypothetical protein BV22DRAFT_1134916 [Leucogyrophana mollusca]|uniref:Uncharacterized protein n=1 Tax=Leucogyrophana mollusca TaxID=85980 RepID=A0ACB8AYW0_9AGAM|nr:hypothetical protein BV22DRAFT_1134916 [Leucogyrophana mollusca]
MQPATDTLCMGNGECSLVVVILPGLDKRLVIDRGKERTNSTQIALLNSEIAELQKSLENMRTSYQSLQKQYQEQCAESERYRNHLCRRDESIKDYADAAALHVLEAAKWDREHERYEERLAHAQLDERKQENLMLKETIDRMRYDMDEMRSAASAVGGGGPSSVASSAAISMSKSLGVGLMGKMGTAGWGMEDEGQEEDAEESGAEEGEESEGEGTEEEDVIHAIITRKKRKITGRANKDKDEVETITFSETKEYCDASMQHAVPTAASEVQSDAIPTSTAEVQASPSAHSVHIETPVPIYTSETHIQTQASLFAHEMRVQTDPEPEPEKAQTQSFAVQTETAKKEPEPAPLPRITTSVDVQTEPYVEEDALASSSSTVLPPTPKAPAEHKHAHTDPPPSYHSVAKQDQDTSTDDPDWCVLKKWHKGLGIPFEGRVQLSADAVEEWRALKDDLGVGCAIIDKLIETSSAKAARTHRNWFYNIYNTLMLKPASATRLARGADAPKVLPAAFYHVSRTPTTIDYDQMPILWIPIRYDQEQAESNSSPVPVEWFWEMRTARWSWLKQEDLLCLLRGKDILVNHANTAYNEIKVEPIDNLLSRVVPKEESPPRRTPHAHHRHAAFKALGDKLNTSSNGELAVDIFRALKTLYMPVNTFDIFGYRYLSPVVAYLCLRSVHPDGGFIEPKLLTTHYIKTQFGIRLFLLELIHQKYLAIRVQILPLAEEDSSNAASGAGVRRSQRKNTASANKLEHSAVENSGLGIIQQGIHELTDDWDAYHEGVLDRWATENKTSPFAHTREWIRALTRVVQKAPAKVFVHWNDDDGQVQIQGHAVNISDYKTCVQSTLQALIDHLDKKVLFGLKIEEIALTLPKEDSGDSDTQFHGLFSPSADDLEKDGDPAGAFLDALCDAGKLCKKSGDDIMWDTGKLAEWLVNVEKAWAEGYVLQHLLSIPGRMTEEELLQHANSKNSRRHLFLSLTLKTLVTISNYSKNSFTNIPRYPLIRPVQLLAALQFHGTTEEKAAEISELYRTRMYVTADRAWDGKRLSDLIQGWFMENLQVPFGARLHRHFAQALQRRFLKYTEAGDLAAVANLAMGHGKEAGDMHYAMENGNLGIPPSLQA